MTTNICDAVLDDCLCLDVYRPKDSEGRYSQHDAKDLRGKKEKKQREMLYVIKAAMSLAGLCIVRQIKFVSAYFTTLTIL